jgi:hypothetical protein
MQNAAFSKENGNNFRIKSIKAINHMAYRKNFTFNTINLRLEKKSQHEFLIRVPLSCPDKCNDSVKKCNLIYGFNF